MITAGCLFRYTPPDVYILLFPSTFSLGGGQTSYSCGGVEHAVTPWGNFHSPSQFYVFIGVMAFLYSLAALVLYVWFDDKYRNIDNIPVVVSIHTNGVACSGNFPHFNYVIAKLVEYWISELTQAISYYIR